MAGLPSRRRGPFELSTDAEFGRHPLRGVEPAEGNDCSNGPTGSGIKDGDGN